MCMQELWLVKLLVINELVCVYIRDTASIGTIKNSNKNQDYTYWIEPIKIWTTIYKGQFWELKQMARFAFTDYLLWLGDVQYNSWKWTLGCKFVLG